ncbi:Uncharacterised protein [Yersinia pseudotuberculosis]|nr:Uncharacterised protein [Yersinia pseudotuberculosis]
MDTDQCFSVVMLTFTAEILPVTPTVGYACETRRQRLTKLICHPLVTRVRARSTFLSIDINRFLPIYLGTNKLAVCWQEYGELPDNDDEFFPLRSAHEV